MSEKWKTEFFEWKDGIEAKFNNLSQKNIELERKLESIPLANDVKLAFKDNMDKALDLIGDNKEQIAELKEHIKVYSDNQSTILDNQGKLIEQINGLKEKVNYLEDRYKESGGLRCLRDRGSIKEVLRKTLKKLADVGISGFINEELLEKLDSKVGSARQMEKKEFKCPICQEEISLETEFDCPTCESEITLKEIVDSGKKEVIEVYEGEYEKVTDPITRVTNYLKKEPKEKELYELYLKDKEQYYFKKITHPFTELNNMVHLGIGEVVATREDLKELLEMYHEGYASDRPAVVEFLERIKEVWGV